MVGSVPGFLPKTALVGSRVIYKPFAFPAKLDTSMKDIGVAGGTAIQSLNDGIKGAWSALGYKGPFGGIFTKILDRVDSAVARNAQIAQRNEDVFWHPATEGVRLIGQAVAGPGAYWYLRKGGVEQPSADQIKSTLEDKLFHFPDPAGDAPAPAPDPEPAPAPAPEGEPAPAPSPSDGGEPAPAPADPTGGTPGPTVTAQDTLKPSA